MLVMPASRVTKKKREIERDADRQTHRQTDINRDKKRRETKLTIYKQTKKTRQGHSIREPAPVGHTGGVRHHGGRGHAAAERHEHVLQRRQQRHGHGRRRRHAVRHWPVVVVVLTLGECSGTLGDHSL